MPRWVLSVPRRHRCIQFVRDFVRVPLLPFLLFYLFTFLPLERLVDIEEESSLSALAETIVETHVDVLLEFPSIAHSEVGQM